MSSSVEIIIPNIWKNKKCSKPPTSIIEIENTNIWNHQPNEKSMLHWKSLWPTFDSFTSHHVITFRLSWLPKTYKNTRPPRRRRDHGHTFETPCDDFHRPPAAKCCQSQSKASGDESWWNQLPKISWGFKLNQEIIEIDKCCTSVGYPELVKDKIKSIRVIKNGDKK